MHIKFSFQIFEDADKSPSRFDMGFRGRIGNYYKTWSLLANAIIYLGYYYSALLAWTLAYPGVDASQY